MPLFNNKVKKQFTDNSWKIPNGLWWFYFLLMVNVKLFVIPLNIQYMMHLLKQIFASFCNEIEWHLFCHSHSWIKLNLSLISLICCKVNIKCFSLSEQQRTHSQNVHHPPWSPPVQLFQLLVSSLPHLGQTIRLGKVMLNVGLGLFVIVLDNWHNCQSGYSFRWIFKKCLRENFVVVK